MAATLHSRPDARAGADVLLALALAVPVALLAVSLGAVEGGALLAHGRVLSLDGTRLDGVLSPLAHPLSPEDGWPVGWRGVAPGRGLFWLLIALELALAAAVAAAVGSLWVRHSARRGFASYGDVRQLSAATQRARARHLQPRLGTLARRTAPAGAVGVYCGRRGLRRLYGSVEDVYLLVGAIRRGKTGLLTEMLADWQGPVLLTTTKPGDAEALLPLLGEGDRRRVRLFDPLGLSPWPDRVAWDPVAGCDAPLVAASRANALMAPVRRGASDRDGVDWGLLAELLLSSLLHAAAVDGLAIDEVVEWSQAPSINRVLEILGRSPSAAHWRRIVQLQAGSAPETWASIQVNLQTALAAVRQPAVLRWLRPASDDEALDPARVVARGDALVILGTDAAQSNMAPLTAALCDAVIEAGLAAARHSSGGRLDPPLLLALDEVAKIAPLPALPRLASEGSSQGIVPVLVAQDPGQLRAAFGEGGADALWTCASAKLVFGGITGLRDREQISALSREVEVADRPPARLMATPREPISRRVRALPVDAVYRIAREHAVLFYGGLDPVHVSARGPHHRTSRLHRRWRTARAAYAAKVASAPPGGDGTQQEATR